MNNQPTIQEIRQVLLRLSELMLEFADVCEQRAAEIRLEYTNPEK